MEQMVTPIFILAQFLMLIQKTCPQIKLRFDGQIVCNKI